MFPMKLLLAMTVTPPSMYQAPPLPDQAVTEAVLLTRLVSVLLMRVTLVAEVPETYTAPPLLALHNQKHHVAVT